MTADKGTILLRYSIIIICILIVCIAILTRAGRTIFVEREEWQKKADSLKNRKCYSLSQSREYIRGRRSPDGKQHTPILSVYRF